MIVERKPAPASGLEQRQRIEIDFWRESATEKPGADSVENIVNKMGDAGVFLTFLGAFDSVFAGSKKILELGAGQGWASCLVKRKFPQASLTATDISPYAITSIHMWEHIFGVRVDRAYPCKSYEIPEGDSSVDCVFCYASAHHFVAHKRTLREVYRVLRPGGHCLYLHEPSCRWFIYWLALWRVRRKRPDVPEDVIRYPELIRLAKESGFEPKIEFTPIVSNRAPLETVYYAILSRIPPLQRVLPCCVTYIFEKP
jgi:SAM-dependent methyltransferase